MDERLDQVEEIFQVACELPAGERERYLEVACEGDAALRAEVEELLAYDVDPAELEPDAPPHEPLVPGALFATRYRIVSCLGRGSAGVVYRAVDERLGQPVALKVLRASSPLQREQLGQEVRLARRVTHPAVCRVHDIGESGSDCFLSMELVDGESLAARLVRAGRLAPERVLQIARDLLEGIDAAHAEGVLHRDLKPANLLMDAAGRVHITDFGIALGGEEPGLPAGTPAYMAPEQRRGEALSAQTDLYALGVVCYELLTGELPGSPLRAPSQRVAGIDPRLERAVLTALESDPAQRPSSARVMLEMLAAPLAVAPPREPHAVPGMEIRHVTALFLERTDEREYAGRAATEDVLAVVSERRSAVMEVLERHGGQMVQRMGPRVLMLFGAPIARADAAQRALAAALDILETNERMNRRDRGRLPFPAMVRMGLHADEALVEVDAAGAVHASGRALEVARALCELAAPGERLLSEELRTRVGSEGFDFEARQALELAGEAPLPIHRARRAPRRRRPRSAPGPFFGRAAELALLEERWQRARRGTGQVVLIRGEAGLGKSRLLRELRRRLGDGVERWYEATCSPYTANTPLFPHSQVLAQVCGFEADDPWERRQRKVRAALDTYRITDPELRATVESLLAIDDGTRSVPAASPSLARLRTFRAIAEVSRRYATEQPSVCVIEDLHWADPTTLELLRFAIALPDEIHLLLICTTRPELDVDWPAAESFHEMRLPPLGREEVRGVAATAAPRPLGESTLAAIAERAEGNPFFAEELTRGFDAQALPPSLKDSLMARLDTLGEDRRVAQLAAVLGRVFRRDVLWEMEERPYAELDEALHRLEARGLIVSHGMPPGSRFQFRHALLCDAAYESIPPGRRARLHARAARAIEAREPRWALSNPEVVARHFERAGLLEETARAWERAAERALESGAFVEADAHLRWALEAVAQLAHTPERDELELHLLLLRGRALLASRSHASPEVELCYARAHALARDLRPTELGFRGLSEIWRYQTLLCDGRAGATAEELGQVARATGGRHLEALAEAAGAQIAQLRGRHGEVREQAERALALAREIDPKAEQARFYVSALAHAALARSAWLAGEPERALCEARAAEAIAPRLEHPSNAAIIDALLAYLYDWVGDEAHAAELVERGLARATLHGLGHFAANARGLRSQQRLRAGDVAGALDDARAQLETLQALGCALSLGLAHAQLAEAQAAGGDLDAAVASAREAVRLSSNPEDCSLLAEAHRVLGELLARRGAEGDAAEAQRQLERALEVAHSQGARSLELRAADALERMGPGFRALTR